ncbi:MAG: Gfo/Idh/MocA family oxidoreductase [Pseudomonadota bacterium]|nr:Gfo/Idh/MocA family oxidoreductase [Pseudomonadota bacterium]
MEKESVVAIIGFGQFGRKHAARLTRISNVCEVVVADPSPAAAEEAKRLGLRWFHDYECLPATVDAAVIAMPPEMTHDAAVTMLERGSRVLLEKPMCKSLKDADSIIAAAQRTKSDLFIGMVERFNGAVLKFSSLEKNVNSVCSFTRLGHRPHRSFRIDPILDLMIHDIDLVHHFLRTDDANASLLEVRKNSVGNEMVSATVDYGGGRIVSFLAGYGSEDVRRATLTTTSGDALLDFRTQNLTVNNFKEEESVSTHQLEDGRFGSLKRELNAFLGNKESQTSLATAADGRSALALALRISERTI